MARAFSLIAFGLLFSLPSTLAVRTRAPGDASSVTDSALTSDDGSGKNHISLGGYAEANCGRLTVRGGLKVGDRIKVTANGWGKSDADFIVELVTDNSLRMAQVRSSPTEEGPGLAGGGGPEGGSAVESTPDGGEDTAERPAIPIIGLRVPASKDEDGSSRKPAVLLYGKGEESPKEFPLDSPAGPTSAFFVVFSQKSATEMGVQLFTWISKGSGANGSWHEASVDVGLGLTRIDVMVVINDCDPHSLRIYGSKSADLLTADGEMCKVADPQLVSLTAPHTQGSLPVVEASSAEASSEA